jgi:hypothetical protein
MSRSAAAQSRLIVMINDVCGNWTVFSVFPFLLMYPVCHRPKVGQETGRWACTLIQFQTISFSKFMV